MIRTCLFLLALMAALVPAAAASPAADGCLTDEQARTEILSHKLVSIQQATRAARASVRGDVVSANLCRVNERLVYVLAILAPGGKVSRVTVDATTSAIRDQR
ncbi:MAG TPA: hypothetical protein PLQ11_01240 [Beijerinckiaceae bacterium]|nr:hypothetical protein [Beijerinckiaceae bacterium]